MQLNNSMSWLITGVAGFIGSHLLEKLLLSNQTVVGIDNFSTGKRSNLDEVRQNVPESCWDNFSFVEGDIRSASLCEASCKGIDVVLHQAAIASVIDSFENPNTTNAVNIEGFVNMLLGARKNGVKRFVYASSSAVYGNSCSGSISESTPLQPLSPYALSKYVNEVHAAMLSGNGDLRTVGLRYFNVYGPRQSVGGAYAAVIPLWISAVIKNQPIQVYGDGSTTRDFCYVADVVQANLLAAIAPSSESHLVFNVGSGYETNLVQLFEKIYESLGVEESSRSVNYLPFRQGEVLRSHASVHSISNAIGYKQETQLADGLKATINWHLESGKNFKI